MLVLAYFIYIHIYIYIYVDKKSNINKPSTYNNIPAKIVVDTVDICALIISKIYNDSILRKVFPGHLKIADITPVHKKDETTTKEN